MDAMIQNSILSSNIQEGLCAKKPKQNNLWKHIYVSIAFSNQFFNKNRTFLKHIFIQNIKLVLISSWQDLVAIRERQNVLVYDASKFSL